MRATLVLDGEQIAKAQALTGLSEKSALVREALQALIERESARRLARLGGSEPDLAAVSRRRARSERCDGLQSFGNASNGSRNGTSKSSKWRRFRVRNTSSC